MEAPSKKLALGPVLWGVVVIVVLVGFAISGYYLAQRYIHPAGVGRSFPGNLVLSFPAPWTAPSNERLVGLVMYTPARDSFYNMAVLKPGIIFSFANGSVSPDGTKLLATQVSATSSSLVIYSLALQQVASVLDREPAGTQFMSMNWAGDGSKISYMVFPAVTPNTLAADGKPLITLQNGKYVTRTGAKIATSSLPTSYVISSDGSHKLSLGTLQPGVFSPDGTMVFVEGGFGPILETIATGAQRSITKPTDGTFPGIAVNLVYDAKGTYVGMLGKTGPLVVYKINWQNATLTHIGTTASRPAAEIFGNNDQLLTFEGTPAQAVTYNFAATTTAAIRQTYSLTLPGMAQLVAWTVAAQQIL